MLGRRANRVWLLSFAAVLSAAAGLPQDEQQEPVRVGGDIKEPKKIKHVNPVYPEEARQAGAQGIVIMECIISPEGKVTGWIEPDQRNDRDTTQVASLPARTEGRRQRRDADPNDADERVHDLLGHALAEVLLALVGAHVGEGQHRDRDRSGFGSGQ